MKKFKRHIFLLIISLILLITGCSGKVYAQSINAWYYLYTTQADGWYCLQHQYPMINGSVDRTKYSGSFTSAAKKGSFQRAFAYLMKHAQGTTDNGWKNKDQLNNNYHQQALWGLLWDYKNSLPSPFNVNISKDADLRGRATTKAAKVEDLIDAAKKAESIPFYDKNSAKINTTNLNMISNVGSIQIKQLTGTVTSIYIKWKNGTEYTTTRKWGN